MYVIDPLLLCPIITIVIVDDLWKRYEINFSPSLRCDRRSGWTEWNWAQTDKDEKEKVNFIAPFLRICLALASSAPLRHSLSTRGLHSEWNDWKRNTLVLLETFWPQNFQRGPVCLSCVLFVFAERRHRAEGQGKLVFRTNFVVFVRFIRRWR